MPAWEASGRISVALCTFNGSLYLREQIQSILAQSVVPDQIVLSDDGSSDGTVEIVMTLIRDFAANGGSVELVLLQNVEPLGVTRNFEQAIARCDGEFVVLADQDDVWQPDRVANSLTYFANRPHLFLMHGDATLIDPAGRELGTSLFEALGVDERMMAEVHSGRAFELLMRRNIVTGATVMFRRSLAELAMPFPNGWVHDEWLAMVAAAVDGMDVSSESIIGYRQHGANQIGVEKLSLVGRIARILEPGTARNHRLLQRAIVLPERLQTVGASPDRLEAARVKIVHEQMRSLLKPSRVLRIIPIVQELRSGRYRRFGRGIGDAVRDLLQPLGAPR